MRIAVDATRREQASPSFASRPLVAQVFEGLSEPAKQLPSVLLFDAKGARLYEQASAAAASYVPRTESALLRRHGPEMARHAGTQLAVVHFGAADGRAAGQLLAAMREVHCYVPIDVEPAQLARACEYVHARFPTLRVFPACQDFREYFGLPAAIATARRRLAFFPGATIGLYRPLEVVALLNSMREAMGPGGGLLVGVDLLKDRETIRRAYDDEGGSMAAFNRNVLVRLNRELAATFDPDAFAHRVDWNEDAQRVEMSLESRRAQNPTVAGIGVALAAHERILTAYGHKYTIGGFGALAHTAGWSARATWVDEEHAYALQFLEAAE